MVCCAVRKLVSQLSPRFYKLDEVSDEAFDEVVALMEKHDAAEVIISELNEIIHDKERFKVNDHLMLHGTLFCLLLVFIIVFIIVSKFLDVIYKVDKLFLAILITVLY